MEINNIFKNRAGTIQLSDLDDNFNTVKVGVTAIESQITTIQSSIASLVTQIANFSAIPIGCIVIWNGAVSNIPSGWRLCDGTNGTPDLRDKFVVGARSDSGGSATTFITGADTKSGGTKDAVIVSHVHNATSTASSTANSTASSTASVTNDTFSAQIRATDSGLRAVSGDCSDAGVNNTQTFKDNTYSSVDTENSNVNFSHTHNHIVTVATTVNTTVATNVSTSVDTVGESGNNKNLPPYYSVAYIMKV